MADKEDERREGDDYADDGTDYKMTAETRHELYKDVVALLDGQGETLAEARNPEWSRAELDELLVKADFDRIAIRNRVTGWMRDELVIGERKVAHVDTRLAPADEVAAERTVVDPIVKAAGGAVARFTGAAIPTLDGSITPKGTLTLTPFRRTPTPGEFLASGVGSSDTARFTWQHAEHEREDGMWEPGVVFDWYRPGGQVDRVFVQMQTPAPGHPGFVTREGARAVHPALAKWVMDVTGSSPSKPLGSTSVG